METFQKKSVKIFSGYECSECICKLNVYNPSTVHIHKKNKLHLKSEQELQVMGLSFFQKRTV